MFTSSSLTDAAIPVGRRHLFEQLVVDAADLVLAQETYHDHQWRDRPHMSVRMSRADAATVSQTFLSIDGDRIGVRFVRITDPS
jgi:hypothetical protein